MKPWNLVLVVVAGLAGAALAAPPAETPAASASWTRASERPKSEPAAAPPPAEEPAAEPSSFGLAEPDAEAAAATAPAAPGAGEAASAVEDPAAEPLAASEPAPAGEPTDGGPGGEERAAGNDASAEAAMAGADAGAEPGAQAGAEPGAEPSTDAPAALGEAPIEAAPVAAEPAAPALGVALGPIAYDDEGRKGRIHTVIPGDTLWDISEAYLGTPWVWPTVWNDNGGIANPHRIEPGDRIWISSTEMRRLSDDEAMQMLAGRVPPAAQEDADLGPVEPPADAGIEGAPATMDALPVALDEGGRGLASTGETLQLSGRGAMSFVAGEVIDGAASIVGSTRAHSMLSAGDEIYIGLGRGDVEAGDRFSIFRDPAVVRDPRGRVLGYHVDVVGHVEVEQVDLESSLAVISESQSEIGIGDLVMARQELPSEVPVKHAPAGLHGRVIFLPLGRTMMGKDDVVYVDRGSVHGLEVGSELEVFEHGYPAHERTLGRDVRTPDLVVGRVVIVSLQPDTSVGYVVSAEREIEVGDLVRSRVRDVAAR